MKRLANLQKIILRCPFDKCDCRIIGYKLKLDNLVAIKHEVDCVELDDELKFVNGEKSQEFRDFVRLNDSWDFDNIGVSKPTELQNPVLKENGNLQDIDIQRYLVCADCERGPLGFAGYLGPVEIGDTEDERIEKTKDLVFFLSTDSVKYELS